MPICACCGWVDVSIASIGACFFVHTCRVWVGMSARMSRVCDRVCAGILWVDGHVCRCIQACIGVSVCVCVRGGGVSGWSCVCVCVAR